ncbi:tetratricopeptide repeat protein [Sphingobacterium humi]|uniref:Tetratricopeptide repeat protein n=1 Tax=Sphingobacterium humi TaxID=1796905 RepID=A0A6N8L440_9SPHI|nr:tetratricopeptide repeat protein [Sphingobacterium humi]MVZ64136.1 tetratricopeptide repeat protein [Sphingobacterium humi]
MNRRIFTIHKGLFLALLAIQLSGYVPGQSLHAQELLQISDKDDLVKNINKRFGEGKYKEAKAITEQGLKRYPKDGDLKMLLGKYYVLTKQYDKARYELNKALEYNRSSVDARHLLVAVETETKRYSSAICFVNELLEVNPYWRGLWRKKIELYRLQGNEVEANRLLKRISQVFPGDSVIQGDVNYQMEMTANDKRKAGKIDDAIEINKLLLQEKPRNLEVYLDLINGYIKAGDYNNALVSTERGLNNFPRNKSLADKKVAILEHNKRYDEILAFLQKEMGGSASSQYNYFLLEAARSAKDNDPAILYGKILEGDAGNEEAFQVVFNHLIAQQQYDEALDKLRSYARIKGMSKPLQAKELSIYRLKNDKQKEAQLIKTMYLNDPNDMDLREAYVGFIAQEIKDHLGAEEWATAEGKILMIIPIATEEYRDYLNNALQNSYFQQGKYREAIDMLDRMKALDPSNQTYTLKKASILMRMQQVDQAVNVYEELFRSVPENQQFYYLSGYNDMMMQIVKESNESNRYLASLNWVNRWLAIDPSNKQALMYGINLAHQMKNKELLMQFAERAKNAYPDDSTFRVHLVMAMQQHGTPVADVYGMMKEEVQQNPYNDLVVKTFVQSSYDYSKSLLEKKESTEAIKIANEGLSYHPMDKELKYLKGIAYEKLKQYDSAIYYQSFYEPSLMELDEFKSNLKYLQHQSYNNELVLSHNRARFGDNYSIQTISMLEYTTIQKPNSFTGRVLYSGREEGRGLQGQVEWGRIWSPLWSTRIDVGYANKYFPKYSANGTIIRTLPKDWEIEAGAGYREFYDGMNLSSVIAAVGKDLGQFRLQGKFTQSFVQQKWLYNAALQARYSLDHPKNYLLAMANIGSTPDIELLDYQYINTLSVLNSMVGAGAGRLLTKNIAANILGTWYNFQSPVDMTLYRNLYNLYFQLNVKF